MSRDKPTARYVDAPPKASVLIESMRDVGYSLETALADLIDNSISARATAIDIRVDAASDEARIAIIDNGQSMSGPELLDSMRLGSRHPRDTRPAHDLGRFGLGLKTASFSQCRRLTVVARKAGVSQGAVWDLDEIGRTDQWRLQTIANVDSVPFIERLVDDGTLVLWEKMDRSLEQGGTEPARRHFLRLVDHASKHLELVFHRYLAGEPGTKRVAISVNDLPLKPFDPFHSSHPATIRGQLEKVRIGAHTVEITSFTLPHHRNVTRADWDLYGGEGGYLKNQGFYLYREKRLIVHGTWFGLARQTELTKLARVRIDMSNVMDEEWLIDVKKASARPPLAVRERLQRLVTELGGPSRTIFTKRGRKLHGNPIAIWQRVLSDNQITYRLNAENPSIAAFTAMLSDPQHREFDILLQAISAGLPTDALFADLAGSPETVKAVDLTDEVLVRLVHETVTSLRDKGFDLEATMEMCRVAEPFRSHWERGETMVLKVWSEAENER